MNIQKVGKPISYVLIAGLILTVAGESYAGEATKPHIPEVSYFAPSTSGLTYIVSGTTSGTVALASFPIK